MRKRRQRALTPLGAWIKAQSILKNVELRSIAGRMGIWPQNLTDKLHGVRQFRESEIFLIEKILGEKYIPGTNDPGPDAARRNHPP